MEKLKNFGVIRTQKFLSEFNWMGKTFNSYLISFNEYEGYFRINRAIDYEQALIGAQVLFNVTSEQPDKIQKYKILGYEIIELPKMKVK